MSIPSVRLHRPLSDAFRDRTRVVLVQPSHPGNVGACARAMRVMGLRHLRLVDPVRPDVLTDPQAVALASGAQDVLDLAACVPTLDAALADVSLAIAVSAETREFAPPPLPPARVTQAAIDELRADASHRVAFVFGPERTGLSVHDVARCQLVCSIPGDPDYNSLNLSQAVQIVAYEWRQAALRGDGHGDGGDDGAQDTPSAGRGEGPRASGDELERLYEHLSQAAISVGFLDPAHPKKLMARLRRLLGRARPTVDEVQLLRGLCKLIESPAPGSPAARRR